MRKALLRAALLAALTPATARADIFEGSAADATGETAPAREIAAVSARYDDREGTVWISVQLAAPADQATNAVPAATLGKGCGGATRAVFATTLVSDPAAPGIFQTDGSAQKPLTRGGRAVTPTRPACT